MDNETFLKKLAQHCRNNNQISFKKRKLSCAKKVQIVFKSKSTLDKVDIESLKLYRQIMTSRYGKI